MVKKRISLLVFISLLLAANAGLSIAHDTGQPHSHDTGDEFCKNCGAVDDSIGTIDEFDEGVFAELPENHPPVAILAVTLDGKVYSLQWLWRHLLSVLAADEGKAPRLYTHSHQHAHSHTHEHSHSDSGSHSHLHSGTQSEPHSHWHSHLHSHEHAHRSGIPHDFQHEPAFQVATSPALSPNQYR